MYEIAFSNREEVEAAIKAGKRLMLCTVGEDNKPDVVLSEAICKPLISESENAHVNKAIAYVKENFRKPLRLDDIAAYCEVSSAYLSRIFSLYMDETLTDYILSFRMNRAAWLLTTTSDTVVSIAREVGCPDGGYFNKLFRGYFGMTPLTYRKNNVITKMA